MPPRINGKNTKDIGIDGIGTPSYRNLKNVMDGYISAGYFEGGTISDSGSGQVDVTAIKGIIKTTNSDTGVNVAFDLAAQTDVSLTDNSINYIYVDYNSGAPIMSVTTDYSTITHTTQIVIGRVYRNGTILYISNVGAKICNATLRDMYRLRSLRKIERASGAEISCPSSRYIAITASVLFSNYTKITTSAFDSSGTDRWITWYRNGSGGFNQTSAESLVNNTQYDNNVGTLTSLTTNYYTVHWFYLVPTTGSQIHMVVGQAQYQKLVDTNTAVIPALLPGLISEMGLLVGKVIVQQGVSTLISLESAFTIELETATPNLHNELSGLQGGAADQYFHLTTPTAPAAGLRNITAIDNGETARTDKALFDATNPVMDGTASPGTAMVAARRDHVHGSDTTKATDTAVFHKATASEISALTAKTTAVAADMLLAEDSANSNNKKKITVGSIPLDTLKAPTDITTLNATTSLHGLLLKATAPASGVRNVVCIDNAETVYKNSALFDSTNPASPGTAAPGTSLIAARRDHVHASQSIGWYPLVSTTDFTTTALSTSTIDMNTDQTANIKVGMPIRFTLSSVVYYAICTSITSTVLTIGGAPLTTSAGALTALAYGDACKVQQMTIQIPGYFEETAYTSAPYALESLLFMRYGVQWQSEQSYCVYFNVRNRVADTGTAPIINLVINGGALSTSNTNTGLSVPAITTYTGTIVDINTTYYDINRGEYIEVMITKGTDTVKAQDLTITVVFVSP